MKLFYSLLFSFAFIFINQYSYSQVNWEGMRGVPEGADMEGFSIAPDGTWWIVGDQVLYSSPDKGKNWICETEHGFLAISRRLKFLEDGTPIWGDQNQMIIKRNGDWVRLGYSNDFETYKDTIYGTGIGNGIIYKSGDKGLNWDVHIFMQGSTIYRYRRHNNRHYVEYSNSPNRKYGEVTLKGGIVRTRFANSTGFKAFLIDDCNNVHYFYNNTHSILYSNGTGETKDISSLTDKISVVGKKVFRLQNGLQATVNCGIDWEVLGPSNGAFEFFPISEDTLIYVHPNRIAKVNLPEEELESQVIKNIDLYSWDNQEMADGTIYLRTNEGDYRILPDGTIDATNFNVQFVKYGPNGWLYRNILNNGLGTDTIFISNDRGDTWEKILFPEGADNFSDMYPITNDIIAFTNYMGGTLLWFKSENMSYEIPSDPDNNLDHSYSEFKVVNDKVIMIGNQQAIASFDLIDRSFQTQLFTPEWELGFSHLDNDGNFYGITDDKSQMNVVKYPYSEVETITLPEDHISSGHGEFRRMVTVNEGALVLYRYALFHIDKNAIMTQIPLGPATGVQLNEIRTAESGRWILRTFGKQQAYITSNQYPTEELGTRISGQIIGTDEDCHEMESISASQWKIKLSNTEHEYFAFGQESGKFGTYLQAGEYEVEIVPPSYSTWNNCNWPEQLTVVENQTQDSFNIKTRFVNACDAATISISAPFYRRCFESYVFVELTNVGQTILHSPVVTLTPQIGLDLVSSSFVYSEESGEIQFDLNDIAVGEKIRIPCLFKTSCHFNLGDQICISAQLEVNDPCTELADTDELCLAVIGSWDPNEKYVTNASGTDKKYFKEDDYMHFKIRFQNVGSDTAFNVRVVDNLDPHLDLLTLEVLSASHDHTFNVDESRELTILYENIMLPDSARNEAASHGYFEFRIKPNQNFTVNDSIQNNASIYFDFNGAVVTNKVTAQLERVSATSDENFNDPAIIWPNPANNYIYIDLGNRGDKTDITIYDMSGKPVTKISNYSPGQKISIAAFSKGYYFIRINSASEGQLIPFVKI